MTRDECLRRAEAALTDASDNLVALGADLNKAVPRGTVPTELVARLTAVQVQLGEAWTLLAGEKAT